MTKNYDILDLTKYILSLFVVAIHTRLGIRFPFLFPWLRLAVPMFFVISSFLVFTKLKGVDAASGWKTINRTAVRLLVLYLFWLVIQLPYVINYRQGWFSVGVPFGIHVTLFHTLFNSTFPTSWFIVATIESLYIIYFFRVFRGGRYRKMFFYVSVVIYLLYCVWTCYCRLFPFEWGMNSFMGWFQTYLFNPAHSFFAALFWVQAGALIADGRMRMRRKTAVLTALASGILLFAEWKLVAKFVGGRDCEGYLFLAPLVISLFLLLKDIDISLKHALILRKISVITFCSHCCVFFLIRHLTLFQTGQHILAGFLLTVLACHLISLLFIKLEKIPWLSWLRYSH